MSGCRNWDGKSGEKDNGCTEGLFHAYGGLRPSFTGDTINTDKCYIQTVTDGVKFEFKEYPKAPFRESIGRGFNIPKEEENAVMYGPPIPITPNDESESDYRGTYGYQTYPTTASMCGKPFRLCGTDGVGTRFYLGNYPSRLSYRFQASDTWIRYLYDTANNAGVAGTPCFWLETEEINDVGYDQTGEESQTPGTPPTGEPGDPDYDPGSEGTYTPPTFENTGVNESQSEYFKCHPCANFYCTPKYTTLSYTGSRDLTGDPDCPHPTLFGIGTYSRKLVFTYNALSSVAPDGVRGWEVQGSGTSYTNVWGSGDFQNTTGIQDLVTTDNPWVAGEQYFTDFVIFRLNANTGNTSDEFATGFEIKVNIRPQYDEATSTFTGTVFEFPEWLSPGVRYSVGDNFTLTYAYDSLVSNYTYNFNLNLRVTSTADADIVDATNLSGFDKLRPGDRINGHNITRVFHTDMENFGEHILYVDGSGGAFSYNQNYSSNRNHSIRAIAGFGIPDKAILIGQYEFLAKSTQFTTSSLDSDSPDDYNNGFKQPTGYGVVSNGKVTSIRLEDGGAQLKKSQLGKKPVLEITAPDGGEGRKAVVQGTFSGGRLTSVAIIDGGSGYSGRIGKEPQLYVKNVQKESNYTIPNAAVRKSNKTDMFKTIDDNPDMKYTQSLYEYGELIKNSDYDLSNMSQKLRNSVFGKKKTVKNAYGEKVETIVYPELTESTKTELENILNEIDPGTKKEYTWTYKGRIIDPETGALAVRKDGAKFKMEKTEVTTTSKKKKYRFKISGDKQDIKNKVGNGYDSMKKQLKFNIDTSKLQVQVDQENVRTDILTQYLFRQSDVDPLREYLKPKYSMDYLSNVIFGQYPKNSKVYDRDTGKYVKTKNPNDPFAEQLIARLTQDKVNIDRIIQNHCDNIIQPNIPDYNTVNERRIETVQGSLAQLPRASNQTKYMMTQFRSDTQNDEELVITLSCAPNETGCGHIGCSAPGLPGSSTVESDYTMTGLDGEEYGPGADGGTLSSDDWPGANGYGVSRTYDYYMNGIYGSGCRSWRIQGVMKIYHDRGRAADNIVNATNAYGNPFDIV